MMDSEKPDHVGVKSWIYNGPGNVSLVPPTVNGKKTADQMLRIIRGKGNGQHGQHGWGLLVHRLFQY